MIHLTDYLLIGVLFFAVALMMVCGAGAPPRDKESK